jgi:UDP-galactose transporter B1
MAHSHAAAKSPMHDSTARTKPAQEAESGGSSHHSDSSDDNFWLTAAKLVGCALAIYATFIYYGIIQERIYKTRYGPDQERFSHTFFLLLCQCAANAVFAWVYYMLTPRPPHMTPVPMLTYAKIAFTYLSAMLSSNAALQYMSYPAQVLAKSSKMLPVMLMRIVQVNISYTKR